MRPPQGSLRVFPEIRSQHIDDLNAQSPRPMLFLRLYYYEAAGREIPDDWEQVSKLQALVRVWRTPPETLELFEPLWFRYFRFWVALAATHKLRTVGSRSQRVFFSIENNDLEAIVPRGQRLGGLPTKLVTRLLRLLIPLLVDKIAYGSEASEALYTQFTGARPTTRLIPQVLASRLDHPPAKSEGTVAFVGALHERKGVPLLLRAWETVEDDLPYSHLTIIGDGELSDDTARWAAEKPERRTFRGHIDREQVLQILRQTSLIAIPSQRWGHWREQINGAITEALSVGCTVLTTTETGLAPWLQAHGHTVVPADVSAAEFGSSIASALRSALDPAAVLESLPNRDGRVLADVWLHTLDGEPSG